MSNKERIYDAFGELVYVVAQVDGLIQPEEIETLERILKGHPKASEITWSFNYEVNKKNDIEDLYQKVINCCRENGPDPEYEFLIYLMEEVAKASSGIDYEERAQIDRFIEELIARFKEDIQHINDLEN